MAKTIMVVDDSASLRQVVSIALKGGGYDVIEACDGKDGLAKLTGQKIHLIISDVNMPNLDGIGFIRKARELPKFKFTPILVLTTESQGSKMNEGKEAGATGWIVKPFNSDKLLGIVKKVTG